jgi:hypothetical protein
VPDGSIVPLALFDYLIIGAYDRWLRDDLTAFPILATFDDCRNWRLAEAMLRRTRGQRLPPS